MKNETWVEIPDLVLNGLQKALEPLFEQTDEDITLVIPNPKNKERKIVINYFPAQ